MPDTIHGGKSTQETMARRQARKLGLLNMSVDIADVRTYVDEYTKISKVNNWQQMSMSTAQGAAAVNAAYVNSVFDGRYIYFPATDSDTFVRFDTQGNFTAAGDWSRMSMSTAQGAVALDSAYQGCTFDGRYVYYVAYSSDTFLRFDTKGTSFTTAADWSQMSMSAAQGAAPLNTAYDSAKFDGRYVYISPYDADTFLRFDTQGTSFTTTEDWEKMNMSTAGNNVVDDAYKQMAFDGQYIYYTPYDSDTFIRFNTRGTSFTTEGDWEQISISTAQGGAPFDAIYVSATFDGRYVYYSPYNSDSFIRFDTQGTSFTTAADWQGANMTIAIGSVVNASFYGSDFDGRYIYFSASNVDTFCRFDTQGTSFTTAADWQKISVSTVEGGARPANAYFSAIYGGKYIYFTPLFADTFLRVLACPKAY